VNKNPVYLATGLRVEKERENKFPRSKMKVGYFLKSCA